MRVIQTIYTALHSGQKFIFELSNLVFDIRKHLLGMGSHLLCVLKELNKDGIFGKY